jgi:PA14 domain
VLAARVGLAVVTAVLMASCVNTAYPPGAHRSKSDGGFVAHLLLGQACQGAGDCQSGFCVDNMCCNEGCAGLCKSCARSDTPGYCMPAEAGTDVRDQCPDDGAQSCQRKGVCDGAGACQRYAAGDICRGASCDINFLTPVSRCNDEGVCVQAARQDCKPFNCSTQDRAVVCLTTCTEDRFCVSPNTCDNGKCGALPLGIKCKTASECASGFCESEVCCEKECRGVCQSCNVPGSAGTCTSVPAGGPDPTKTCAITDVTMCGTDGTCDGSGACRLYKVATACGLASCTTATLKSAPTCDGKGHCQAPAATTCGGYTCMSPMACRTACAVDVDCAAPAVCSSRFTCGGLTAQYFRQTNLTDAAFTRTDPNVDFNWGLAAPAGLNVDNFSVRWHGKITARFSEVYTFYVGSDDGERLFVNGVKLIDRYIRHASVPEDVATMTIMLNAGQPVDITMEYFENGGDANVRLLWSSPSEAKAVVPTSALSPQ